LVETAFRRMQPVIGTTADFTLQVIRRGCSDSPYCRQVAGRDAGSPPSSGDRHDGYTDGIVLAKQASTSRPRTTNR
jgi:hypothetical protein